MLALRRGAAVLLSFAVTAPGPALAQTLSSLAPAPLTSAPVPLAPLQAPGILAPLSAAPDLGLDSRLSSLPLPLPLTAETAARSTARLAAHVRNPVRAEAPSEVQAAVGRRLFDRTGERGLTAAVEPPASEPLETAAAPAAPRPLGARVFEFVHERTPTLRRLASHPWAKPLALGVGAAVLMAVLPTAAAPVVGAVALTCNAMQERRIKDQNILPNQYQVQKQAQKELDDILISFGKKLKKIADKDSRVTTDVVAHTAEHGAENPLLDLLPKWRARWEAGGAQTKEEALAELRAEILKELKRTTLPAEDEKLIEELFDKTGSWDELLAWEAKYGVLDALKADSKPKSGGQDKQVGSDGGESGESGSGSSGMGPGTMLMVAFMIGKALLHATGHDPLAFLGAAAVPFLLSLAETEEPAAPQEPLALDAYLNNTGLTDEEAAFLKSYTTDLGAKDAAPVIGRTKEIQRVITILSKPSGMQNNPMILGDKGVGKTAIVEAVAKYLYENRLPALKGKRILELDVGKLTAGTGIQGEMEKRLTQLREIVGKTENKVVLFVDEIHAILKNRATASAVPDLLKGPLRDGKITVIGGTTVGEYRKYVDEDPAFADRFESVMVDEPTIEQAVEMLEGSQEFLERKFDVKLEPDVLEASVRLSSRFIPEKFLPRKARLLLESAIAEAKPQAAKDGLQVQIDQASGRLRLLVKRYAQAAAAAEAGPKEGEAAGRLRAKVVESHNRVVALYQHLLSLESRQRAIEARPVTKEDVVRTLARETGIPIGDLGKDEYEKLMGMEPWFSERVVGQDDAVRAVAATVRRNKSGLGDPNRPQGVFLFPGSTGVGKTEVARRLAEFLFGDKNSMIRLDMSEYMEKFSVQRLFGAPPGYVGYDQGGELTEKVRRRPYSVVLLDEIEKAHPDVLNALLQVFEDGRMTDGKGNTVNFKNTIIIMTSNIGAGSEGEGAAYKADVLAAIKARLRPEFVNRIDQIVVFNRLVQAQAAGIVRILLQDVKTRLAEQDLELDVSDEAVAWLAAKGFDPAFGARPLKRTVEAEVSGALSPLVLDWRSSGRLVNGGKVRVVTQGDGLAFELSANPVPTVELTPLPQGSFGKKLRVLMEQAVKDAGATDPKAFEKLLFPDRGEVKLETMGSYSIVEPEAPWNGAPYVFSLEAPAGQKEPSLAKASEYLSERIGDRLGTAGTEALDAWLAGFVAQAKGWKGLSGSPQLSVSAPAAPEEGRATFSIEFNADGAASSEQAWARLARDHFSEPLPDEDAARARAAELRDEGKKADRSLLDAKRLVQAVPGAMFGHTVGALGSWKFWLSLPVAQAPAPTPAPEPAAEPAQEPASEPAAAEPAAQAPAAAPEAPAVPLISPLEARSSMARMFHFLTQKAQGGPMEPLRQLVIDLLGSPSSSIQLLGLLSARELLSSDGFREIAALGRYMRLTDLREHLLFGELAAAERAAGRSLPMPAQRDAVAEAYREAVKATNEKTRSRERWESADSLLYARNMAAVDGPMYAKGSRLLFAEARRPVARARRLLALFAALQLAALAGWAAGWLLFAGPLGWMIAGAVVTSGIDWALYGSYFGYSLPNGRVGRIALEAQSLERMLKPERIAVGMRWLSAAANGKTFPSLDDEDLARLLEVLRKDVPSDAARGLLARWGAAATEDLKKGPGTGAARRAFASLRVLGRLSGWIPAADQDGFTVLMLRPLSDTAFPADPASYYAALSDWLGSAELAPDELENAFFQLTQGKAIRARTRRNGNDGPVWQPIEALAGRPGLSPSLREAMKQYFMAAQSGASNFPSRRVPIALARLGFGEEAWKEHRKSLENRNANLSDTLELAGLAKPDAATSDWLVKDLLAKKGRELYRDADAYGPLLSAVLEPDPDQNVSRLLSALQRYGLSESDDRTFRGLVTDARKALVGAAERGEKARPGAWKASVAEGLRRLQTDSR